MPVAEHGESLDEGVGHWRIEVEGDRASHSKPGLPSRGHVCLQGVFFVGELEGWQAESSHRTHLLLLAHYSIIIYNA